MKIGIMQPYLFPYIGYFQLINFVDEFIIYDDVNFIKGGWINRNRIIINNTLGFISLQLQNKSSFKKINEINIVPEGNNRNRILSIIKYCYQKAPYYPDVYPIIEDIILNKEDNLAKYITNSLKILCKYIGINTQILSSSRIKKDNNLHGEKKVIDICKNRNASVYINAYGGRKLYSKENFGINNIDLKFIHTLPIKYQQFSDTFYSDLSIIDVLMFNNIKDIKKMMKMFTLI